MDTALHQELCDHVLGQVFGLADGRRGDAPLFCQVMGWPVETTHPSSGTMYVYVRLVPYKTLLHGNTPLYWIPESSVVPRPQTPQYAPYLDWARYRLRRRLDETTGLTQYTVWFNMRGYGMRSEWLVPGHLYNLAALRDVE